MALKNQITKSSANNHEAWQNIKNSLIKIYGEDVGRNWFDHIIVENEGASEVTLAVPTRFISQWIKNNYLDKITKLWQEQKPTICIVDIVVRTGIKKDTPKTTMVGGVDIAGQNVRVLTNNHDLLGSPLDRRFTFENFVVGDCNEFCFAAAKKVASSKEACQDANPLFIHGGVGLGKTHLMHAIAWEVQEKHPERKVIYLSAEKFMYQFVKALKDKEIVSFKEKFRNVDILMIDDVQFISGKQSTQEEFYHTINTLLGLNKQIVISCDRSPANLEGVEERIRSRLGWGLVVDITKTDFMLRRGILQSKVKQMKSVNVPENVVDFLAAKVTSNVRELEGALNKVVAHSTLVGKEITLDSTGKILADLLKSYDRVLTIDEIQKKVAGFFSIKLSDMSSACRMRAVARPRQIAMYLCKTHTQRSLSEIGRKFGGKDHTTIMHAIKKIEQLIKEDQELANSVEHLNTALKC